MKNTKDYYSGIDEECNGPLMEHEHMIHAARAEYTTGHVDADVSLEYGYFCDFVKATVLP